MPLSRHGQHPAAPPARSSPCSTTALQGSARLVTKSHALHRGPASALWAFSPTSPTGLPRSATPPTLPACPVMPPREGCSQSPRSCGTKSEGRLTVAHRGLQHTCVAHRDLQHLPWTFQGKQPPRSPASVLSASFRCAPASTVVPELQAARRGLASCCIHRKNIPRRHPSFISSCWL